jgi:hypothetical protein
MHPIDNENSIGQCLASVLFSPVLGVSYFYFPILLSYFICVGSNSLMRLILISEYNMLN